LQHVKPIGRTFTTTTTTFDVRHDGASAATIRVRGDLDLGTASRFDDLVVELLDRDVRWVRLDARGIDFIDCTGLRALVQAARRCARDRGDFSIVAASPRVERLLDLAGQRRLRIARRRPAA
jgi:anti-sigma B factor antagonist